MSEPDRPSSSDDLGRRLKAARERAGLETKPPVGRVDQTGMGVGFRIAVEFLSALIVGIGLGLVLDGWLGTKPWMLILFFILGSAAGFLNVVRAAQSYDRRRRAEREADGGEAGNRQG